MSRKLLTQRFPFLIPIRLMQRMLFKRISDILKGYKFAKTISQEELPFKVFKYKSRLIRKLGDTDIQLQYNKVTNLKIAAGKMHKVIIRPGETFSFWNLVGVSTKGYKEGVMLLNGNVKKGLGGGLCQLGNLLYWMFLHSELKVVERYRHSFDAFPDFIRVIPFGTGATLMRGIIDLKATNLSNNTYQICIHFDDEFIYGDIRSIKEPQYQYTLHEREHRFIRKEDNQIYRQNKVFRKTIEKSSGNEILDELIIENDCLVKYEIDEKMLQENEGVCQAM